MDKQGFLLIFGAHFEVFLAYSICSLLRNNKTHLVIKIFDVEKLKKKKMDLALYFLSWILCDYSW